MDEDTTQACWDQYEQDIHEWIANGCPTPIPKKVRKGIDEQHHWLREVWNAD